MEWNGHISLMQLLEGARMPDRLFFGKNHPKISFFL
jgi:hypothetical protein